MANDNIDGRVKCPFYKRHGKCGRLNLIYCAQVMSAKKLGFEYSQITGFKKHADFLDYLGIFCCDRFEACPLYQTIVKNLSEERKEDGQKKKHKKKI